MGRKSLDCRLVPSEDNCSVKISADHVDEVLDAGVQHAVSVHGHEDTPELREMLQGALLETAA